LSPADSAALAAVDRRLTVLRADDDERGIEEPLRLQFPHEPPYGLIDELKLARQTLARRSENIGVAALEPGHGVDRQLLTDADGLKVRAEQRRDADLVRAVVGEAVDLIDHGLNVERVIALDVIEAIGPSVIRRRVGKGYRRAAGKLRQRHRNRIDLRAIKIIDAFPARTVGPFIRGMLVSPRGASTAGFHDFEYRVHAQIFVRQNGLAAVAGRTPRGPINFCKSFFLNREA
jgi:hypothetical protein